MSEARRGPPGGPAGASARIDFLGDWAEILRDRLDRAGHPAAPSDDLRLLARKYFNLQKRRIEARPREVKHSRDFHCPDDLLPIIDQIAEASRAGHDLWPYLSRSIADSEYNDALLNDWEIHHFHLGAQIESDGFVARFMNQGDPLLFARVTAEYLLLIDTARHGDWGNQQLIEILHSNWPEVLADRVLPRVRDLPCHLTDSGIKRLRTAGIGTIVEVSDGTVYGPIGSGSMTSGVAKDVIEASIQFQQLVESLAAHVREHAHEYVAELAARGHTPELPQLHLKMDESSTYVVEESVPAIAFRLGSLPTRLIL